MSLPMASHGVSSTVKVFFPAKYQKGQVFILDRSEE
jgi:hypothetical protein